MNKNLVENILVFVLIAIAISFVFFWNLDALSLRTYDESRQAVNALEMSQNGNLIVTYFDGKPDMWSTKPPLLIWIMAGLMRLIGYQELAVRLPSAIAASLVTIVIFSFARFYLQDLKAAFLGAFVLLTTYGFTGIHVARTGDFDALLTLWITLYTLTYFVYSETRAGHGDPYLCLAAIFLGLAILTKGIAAVLPLPGLFLYTFYRKQFPRVFLSKSFYISLVSVILVVFGYYTIREQLNPGFIRAVIENEITGRYLENQEVSRETASDYTFYARVLQRSLFPWLYLLPIAFILTRFRTNRQIRDLGILSLLFLLFHLAVLSYAQRKLDWYCAPQYPIAALLIGIGLSRGIEMLLDSLKIDRLSKRHLISGLLIFGLIFFPSLRITRNILGSYQYNRPNDPEEVQIGYYLRQLQKNQINGRKLSVIDIRKGTVGGRRAHTLFYVSAANLNGFPVDFQYPDSSFQIGDRLVICFQVLKQAIEENYRLEEIDRLNTCHTLQVKGKKNPDRTPSSDLEPSDR